MEIKNFTPTYSKNVIIEDTFPPVDGAAFDGLR